MSNDMENESTTDTTSSVVSELDSNLKALIEKHLHKTVTSYSSVDAIPTGNLYQSIQLRDEIAPGFRKNRGDTFSGMPLSGRSVFDIGCNLGENCRIMRQQGASRVDGLEYEKLFVRLGQLINVYNDLNGIALRQGDASNANEYSEAYDHVFAFSVYPYIKERLGDIARITRSLFFMETHQLNERWVETYVLPSLAHFKFMGVVCSTDWGRQLDHKERRLLLVFSNSSSDILHYASQRAAALKNTDSLCHIDLDKSQWGFLSGALSCLGPEYTIESGIKNSEEWLSRQGWPLGDQDRLDISGRAYWAAFLVGYKQFIEAHNTVKIDNFFVKYIESGLKAGFGDKKLLGLNLREVAERRFRDLLDCEEGSVDVSPIVLFNCNAKEEYGRDYVVDTNGDGFYVLALDGYHRVFSSVICHRKSISAIRFWYSDHRIFNGRSLDQDLGEVLRSIVI